MRAYRPTREQILPEDVESVFSFFSDAPNLERLPPSWLHFEVTEQEPVVIRAGSLLDCHLRSHGLPVRWQSRIEVWQPPFRFVDSRRKGPYRVHTHVFEPLVKGTVVWDIVDYAVSGDRLVERVVVRPEVKRIFDHRARAGPLGGRRVAWQASCVRSSGKCGRSGWLGRLR